MIDTVRNTTLAVANKQNFGYITPSDFNLYSKMAQLDIFEDLFYRYNQWVYKQNNRASGSEYADIVTNIGEIIDIFAVLGHPLTFDTGGYPMPSDLYLISSLFYGSREIAKVNNGVTLSRLQRSNLTAPSVNDPVYLKGGNILYVYPATIVTNVSCDYIRKPLDPSWTWLTIGSGGEPLFNESDALYQDFELPETFGPLLCMKILQYAGISIREAEVVQTYQNEELIDTQKKI